MGRGPGRRSAPAGGSRASARSRRLDRFRPLPSPVRVLGNFALFNFVAPLRSKPLRPRAMCLYVTYRCNMRCQMCGIWKLPASSKNDEWSTEELAAVLRDPLFSRLEFVNLNGGEPNLRQDLVDVARVVLAGAPRLRNLTLNTNGTPVERCIENCTAILAMCRERKVRFGVSVSLHRLGQAYDEVAGVPDAFRKVTAVLEALGPQRRRPGFFLSTNCVLTPRTIDGAEDMLQWGIKVGIPVNFTVAEVRDRFNNADDARALSFDDPELRARLVAFLRRLSSERKLLMQHALRYGELADMIEKRSPRRLACHYALAGVILGSDGALYYCKKSETLGNARQRAASAIFFDRDNLAYRMRELIADECTACLPNTFNSLEMEKDLGRLVRLLR